MLMRGCTIDELDAGYTTTTLGAFEQTKAVEQ